MLDEYYISRGWAADGRPAARKLESLGLTAAAADAGVNRPADAQAAASVAPDAQRVNTAFGGQGL